MREIKGAGDTACPQICEVSVFKIKTLPESLTFPSSHFKPEQDILLKHFANDVCAKCKGVIGCAYARVVTVLGRRPDHQDRAAARTDLSGHNAVIPGSG